TYRKGASARRSAVVKIHAVVQSILGLVRDVGVACNAGSPAACRNRAFWPVKSPSAWVASCPCGAILGVMLVQAPAIGPFVSLNRIWNKRCGAPGGERVEQKGGEVACCAAKTRRWISDSSPAVQIRQGLFVDTQKKSCSRRKYFFLSSLLRYYRYRPPNPATQV